MIWHCCETLCYLWGAGDESGIKLRNITTLLELNLLGCHVQMTYEMYDFLEKPQVERSEKTYIEGSQYLFLEKIIWPIHEILAAVSCNTLSLFWLLTNWIGNAGQLCTFVVKCFAISSSLWSEHINVWWSNWVLGSLDYLVQVPCLYWWSWSLESLVEFLVGCWFC